MRWMWRCLVKLKMIMYVFGWFLHEEGLLVVCTSLVGSFIRKLRFRPKVFHIRSCGRLLKTWSIYSKLLLGVQCIEQKVPGKVGGGREVFSTRFEIGTFIEGVSFRSIEPVPVAEGQLREFLLLSLGVNDVPGLLTKGGCSKHSHPQPPKLLRFVSRNLGADRAKCCPDMVGIYGREL